MPAIRHLLISAFLVANLVICSLAMPARVQALAATTDLLSVQAAPGPRPPWASTRKKYSWKSPTP